MEPHIREVSSIFSVWKFLKSLINLSCFMFFLLLSSTCAICVSHLSLIVESFSSIPENDGDRLFVLYLIIQINFSLFPPVVSERHYHHLEHMERIFWVIMVEDENLFSLSSHPTIILCYDVSLRRFIVFSRYFGARYQETDAFNFTVIPM